jgi:ketosteroid isomerase-like protein
LKADILSRLLNVGNFAKGNNMLPKDAASSFYQAMNNRDSVSMNALYAPNATFSDPVFPQLTGNEVQTMWSMLMRGAQNFTVQHEIRHADDSTVHVKWIATYTFSQTGRRVVNLVETVMTFTNGKIVKQNDHFNFYLWARQALGLPGLLFGWTSWFQRAVQNKTRAKIEKFKLSATATGQ